MTEPVNPLLPLGRILIVDTRRSTERFSSCSHARIRRSDRDDGSKRFRNSILGRLTSSSRTGDASLDGFELMRTLREEEK